MDRRQFKWECLHAQSRTTRKRLNFTILGSDFRGGILSNTWVHPSTGKLQLIPNSEEADWQTSNAGRFAKLNLSTVDIFNSNSGGELKMMAAQGMHTDSAITFVGENGTGVGVTTKAVWAQNTGATAQIFVYGSATDQSGPLIELYWANDRLLAGGGVGITVTQDSKVQIYKDDNAKPVFEGSLEGTGYQAGTVVGGVYGRASNEYVMIRVEVTQGRFITITSSVGGVCVYAAPWAITRYTETGAVDESKPVEPVLPNKKFGWYVPEGGATVVAAPVVYPSSGYAVSKPFQFAEIPTYVGPSGSDVLTARILPDSPSVTGTLKKIDGTTGYDRTTREFRVRLDFTAPAFISGAVGAYPRIAKDWTEPEDGPYDISDYILSSPIAVEDGVSGCSADLSIRGDCPVPYIDDNEGWPFRISLVAHPDDETAPPTVVFLDGVGLNAEWSDGIVSGAQSIRIRVMDRMYLVEQAQFSETVVFDGLPLCQPVEDGESLVSICLREGGLTNEELENLPRIEKEDATLFYIDDTPAQIAGDWNLAAKARQKVMDILEEGMSMAPQYAWGLRPTVDGTRFYAVDAEDGEASIATFYRLPEDALGDSEYEENELIAWPLLYGSSHKRIRLAREGNSIRVNGVDPGTGQGIQAYISQDSSRDPQAALSPDKLGFTREIFVRKRALTTQAMVNRVARKIDLAISKRRYSHSWPAFVRFKSDGSPIWRSDMVLLKGANPDESDAKIRVSGFSFDPRDESGGMLMTEDGRQAPVSVRIAEWSGGAICNVGGATAYDISRLHRERVEDGGSQYGAVDYAARSASFVARLSP